MNVLKKLWRIVQEANEMAHQNKLKQGCEICGATPVCAVCYRCGDPACNGGCIFCVRTRGNRF